MTTNKNISVFKVKQKSVRMNIYTARHSEFQHLPSDINHGMQSEISATQPTEYTHPKLAKSLPNQGITAHTSNINLSGYHFLRYHE